MELNSEIKIKVKGLPVEINTEIKVDGLPVELNSEVKIKVTGLSVLY